MKKNNNNQTELMKKANKLLKIGTAFKFIMPFSGVGEIITTVAWCCAMDDIYHHPENWQVFDTDSYRRLAGKLPKDLEEHVTDCNKNLEEDVHKFCEETKAKIDQIRKDKEDKGESQ